MTQKPTTCCPERATCPTVGGGAILAERFEEVGARPGRGEALAVDDDRGVEIAGLGEEVGGGDGHGVPSVSEAKRVGVASEIRRRAMRQ
jgi:hypothetical protein